MPDQQAIRLVISANDLRALAEAADGLRDNHAYVIVNPDSDAHTSGRPYKVVRKGDQGSAEVVFELLTTSEPPFADRTPQFMLKSDPEVRVKDPNAPTNTPPKLSLVDCDAVFTTLAAVDKFIVPYYARMRRLTDVDDARTKFATDPTALAVVHLPGSVDETARASGSLYTLVADSAWSGEGPRFGLLQPLLGAFIGR